MQKRHNSGWTANLLEFYIQKHLKKLLTVFGSRERTVSTNLSKKENILFVGILFSISYVEFKN